MVLAAVVLCTFAWQRLPDMPAGKAQHACESCGDSVYIAAGGCNGLHVSTMFRYDFRAGAWFECAPAPEKVQSPVMRCVNGKLYFIGGHDSTKGAAGGKTGVCGQYDPDMDRWRLKAPMPTPREDMGSAVIGREIWVFGGLDNRGHFITSSVEVYDTVTDTWTTRDQWVDPRCLGDFACTDGRAIYLMCGTDTMDEYPSLRPVMVPQAYEDGIFFDLPPMPQGHCYTEVELLDGCIYVFGGASVSANSHIDVVDRFDTRRRIWLAPLQMPYSANGVAATQHRGRLYVTGGYADGQFLPYFYMMDRSEPVVPVDVTYGGGHGTSTDPYQIWTAEQMDALGDRPQDWDKHFKLMADIDLSNFDGKEGRHGFHMIAPDADPRRYDFQGPPFAGTFDGDGHTISHLTVSGGEYVGLFGLVARSAAIRDLGIIDANVTGSGDCVGGLIGFNEGTVSHCYSSGTIWGSGTCIGGLIGSNAGEMGRCWSTSLVGGGGNSMGVLIGANSGHVMQCFADGLASGGWCVGGLVGQNWGMAQAVASARWTARAGTLVDCHSLSIVRGEGVVGGLVGNNEHGGTVYCCYSAGPVAGSQVVGGLVGTGEERVACSFWDTRVSSQLISAGGTGLTSGEMYSARTFLDAGWDFAYEAENGTDDIWWIAGGRDYPRLAYNASSPKPYDGAMDILDLPVLRWTAGQMGVEHDIYFGDDESAVVSATSQDPSVYRGRQPAGTTIYDPGALESDKTYYWRIDGVNVADFNSPWTGRVWKFSTADFILVTTVDDFEGYTDDIDAGMAVFQTWADGIGLEPQLPGNGTGSFVGNSLESFAEQLLVHGGRQSMPMSYSNLKPPWCSQAERTWETPQDWTVGGANTLTLYFRGEADNDRDRLYVGIEDGVGQISVVPHRDIEAVLATEWQKWHVPLVEMQATGVDLSMVRRLCIGVGDHEHAQPGGRGRIYIDDIRLTRRMR